MSALSSTLPTQLKNDNRPIGVFDSGIGGLSIQRCITQMLPNEDIIYVADNAYAPYGCKTEREIDNRVQHICQWLVKRNVKAIVVACNTATASSIDKLRQQLDMPIIGVEPAIKPAVAQSKSGKVGIMVTRATAQNERFRQLVARYTHDATVFVQPCPGLVDLIESGQLNSQQCDQLLAQYLSPLINEGVDSIVLGCTHYPFLREKIEQIVGNNIQLIETANPVTEQLIRQLTHHQLLNHKNDVRKLSCFASLPSKHLSALASQLLNVDQLSIEKLDIS